MAANKVIKLPMGWKLELDPSTRPEGEFQGFVFSPDGRESASLAYALEVGTTSGNDECEIPQAVLTELEKYAEQYS